MRTMSMKGGNMGYTGKVRCIKGKYFNVIEEVDFNLDEYIEEKIEDVKAKEQQKPNKKSKEKIGMAKIIVEGRVTYALEGGKVGVAICSPTDNYDREFGERLALARLHNDKVAENELMLGLTTDWTKVEKDTKVIVNGCTKAHFAQYVNGTVWTYPFGKTSFTIDPNMPLRGNYPKYVKIFE